MNAFIHYDWKKESNNFKSEFKFLKFESYEVSPLNFPVKF